MKHKRNSIRSSREIDFISRKKHFGIDRREIWNFAEEEEEEEE
jgi:hypothetical protein